MNFRSEERKHENTKVVEVSSAEFPERVLKGTGKCVVEIFKNDCDACHYNARMFDIFANKMSRHGYLNQVPLYRMNLDNLCPYLGRFLYAPQYLYLEIKEGQITELKTLLSLGDKINCTTFLQDLATTSKVPITDRVKIDSRKHIVEYANKKNLQDDFDIDFDLNNSK